ncbi:septal ring lytic transglycosylase RlpA family protein [Carboxylicivirga sediminis]|uniref:Probable endolytic peptidoglycan transglycosylase RlpA n=1 Tax=Carboxylicivirga sediminis TaxID=2006564 RepID=A0A941F5D4_9BACT|nr:septal ring lytic transglycosylase RlpA family protein [Carboxylicivirga sediminis]MBR8537131.1 septal ring lytic transglycosylase RlpA family protein [Carboxylicivirga sediminis]
MRALLVLLLLLVSLWSQAQAFYQTGKASYYASHFEGKLTASGKVFSNSAMTAAHRTLPFGTQLVVTNLENQKSVVVTISDRGPFIKGRIIDVSERAARELDFYRQGIANVSIESLHQPLPPDSLLQPVHHHPRLILQKMGHQFMLH